MTNTMKKVRSEFNWDGTENHLGISSASVFLLGLASNGPKRPKSPFLGLVRVGPTHGLIALVRFALGLDKFFLKQMKYSNFLHYHSAFLIYPPLQFEDDKQVSNRISP